MKSQALSALLLFAISCLTSCRDRTPVEVDPAFARYIAEFTTGQVSATGEIMVRLRDDVKLKTTGLQSTKGLFDFEPEIEGETYWADERTVMFRPSQALPRGMQYNASLQIDGLIEVEKDKGTFRFPFEVMEQSIAVEVGALEPSNPESADFYKLEVTIHSADEADEAAASKMLTANLDGNPHPVTFTWLSSGREHLFTLDSLPRKDQRGKLVLAWDGRPIQALQNDSREVTVPSFSDFTVLSCDWLDGEDAHVRLVFSDIIAEDQNLDGLITISGTEVTVVREANRLKIYPEPLPVEDAILTMVAGILNSRGYKLKEDFAYTINFRPLTPDIRAVHGTGSILPSSNGTVFPFEAVSLRAVDVKIIKVFENNVPQFLQVNRLEGQRQIKRVGKVVAQRILRLDKQEGTNLRKWNRFYLDLEQYIKTEPGAIYRVELGFKKAYAVTECADIADEISDEQPMPEQWSFENGEDGYWDYYDEYYYYDEYQDPEAQDPCNDSYYYNKRGFSANLLASDLGMLVKRGQQNNLIAFVTDIKSAGSVKGCDLQLLDFQLQSIGQAKTDASGKAEFQLKEGETPFLLVADDRKQKGYLRLDAGSSLSTSRFDVGGNAMQSGMKGFIYGDRGVWRPGDSLFVSFMLEDKEANLPAGHPIVMEFWNPRGQRVDKQVQNLNNEGHHTFVLHTSADALTGSYSLVVHAGGATFTKNLRVETIKPNRLKVELDFGGEEIKAAGEDLEAELYTQWLHGAIARNLKAEVTAVYSPLKTEFTKFKDFVFDDPVRKFYSTESVVFSGQTDATGMAKFSSQTDLKGQSPGKVTAKFSTRVFEPGGDFSIDQHAVTLSPYEDYCGLSLPKGNEANGMLLTDTDHTANVVVVSEGGIPRANRVLKWEVFKVHWRWWWEQGSDNMANWNGDHGYETIDQGVVTTNSTGRASFKVRVDEPAWGRYIIRVLDEESGHSTGQVTYFDGPGWASRTTTDDPSGATMLVFAADKERYSPGQTCTLTFPSSEGARALVSIENGAEVLSHEWVTTTDRQTVYSFQVSQEMAPNVFAAVTILQPHSQTLNDLPIRLYGVMPILVEDPSTRLKPVIEMQPELKPGQKFSVKVKETEGREMSYTVAIVDEGLLDLTRFKTPDPLAHFYAREAHGVMTWDLYDQVIGAYGGKIERLLSIGGDGENEDGGKRKAQRFKPVVMFSGVHALKKGQTSTHTFTMPEYVGSVRAMVVARKSKSYGHAEKTVKVKKPLMVLATLPRVLGPGEIAKLPVTVFTMDGKIKNVKVEVKTKGPVKMKRADAQLSFNETGDQTVELEYEVADRAGKATFEVTCTSGSEKATFSTEVEVRNPNPFETENFSAVIAPGETWDQTFDLSGMTGTNSAVVRVSAFALTNSEKRLRYLLGYPHGCMEQTISKAFPQLYLSEVIEMDKKSESRARFYVQEGINKVVSMQRQSGGVPYWPGQGIIHDWCTSYALHFFIEAKEKGFSVPAGALSKMLDYQQSISRQWLMSGKGNSDGARSSAAYEQAYRVYTMARAGKADLSGMNRMRQEKSLPTTAKWLLAAAYALAGQEKAGRELASAAATQVEEYRDTYTHYGSGLRDMALIWISMAHLGEKKKASVVAKTILDRINSSDWLSTHESAYALLAVSKMVMGEKGKQIKFNGKFNGKGLATNGTTGRPMAEVHLDGLKRSGNVAELKNTSTNPLYVSLAVTGQPATGNESDKSENLSVVVNYTDRSGKPVDLSRIAQGSDLLCSVTVSLIGNVIAGQNLALTQIFPSGFEIRNPRMDAGAASYATSGFDYQDIRDDRVYTYFSLSGSQRSRTFVIPVHAAYRGAYYMPAVSCESMYDPGLAGRKSGRKVDIVSPD